jgi:hypothetical protein
MTKLLLRLKNRLKFTKRTTVKGFGGIGIISNRYLYEAVFEGEEVVGFHKNEVMSRVVELNKQGCVIAVKKISRTLTKEQ